MYAIGIDENMCNCYFRIPNMEYSVGQHDITFQAIVNGEIRGSATTQFFVTDSKFTCVNMYKSSSVYGHLIVDDKSLFHTFKTGTIRIHNTLSS